MSTTYKVKQGDHLFGIAEENGFHDYRLVWDHPQNAELKKTRGNPNILCPGDEVFIPDPEVGEESGSTEKRHSFVINREMLQLRLVLEDIYEKPIAGAACDLILDGEIHKVTTDASGLLELEISGKTKGGVLIVKSDQTPFQGDSIPIKIGHLDPVTMPSGQAARLNSLGYFPGDGDADALLSAIEEFQCDHGLSVDGKCGPGTQAKLQQVYGC